MQRRSAGFQTLARVSAVIGHRWDCRFGLQATIAVWHSAARWRDAAKVRTRRGVARQSGKQATGCLSGPQRVRGENYS